MSTSYRGGTSGRAPTGSKNWLMLAGILELKPRWVSIDSSGFVATRNAIGSDVIVDIGSKPFRACLMLL